MHTHTRARECLGTSSFRAAIRCDSSLCLVGCAAASVVAASRGGNCARFRTAFTVDLRCSCTKLSERASYSTQSFVEFALSRIAESFSPLASHRSAFRFLRYGADFLNKQHNLRVSFGQALRRRLCENERASFAFDGR